MASPDQHLVPLSEPFLGGNARRYLEECLATNYVSSVGPFVERFEHEFAAYVGARYAVACSSGTAALHLSMRLVGVGPGDEVLVSTLTFVASANAITYDRGTPVFVDAEAESWNLDPERVTRELERRARAGIRQPKAVLAVHVLGQPAQLEPLVACCDRYGVTLLEDAAEALGARYEGGLLAGRQVGTIGRLGCFSFNGNKVITCGGGGMVATDDESLARRARHLAAQAKLPGDAYQHDEIGFNYRLTNLAAALGLSQLEQLPEFLKKKREIADRYDAALRNCPGLTLPPRPRWSVPSLWLYSVGIDRSSFGCDRTALLEELNEAGIRARPIWTPLHLMPMYTSALRLGGEVAERLFDRGLSLPCSVGLSTSDQHRVITAIVEKAAGRFR